MFCRFLVVFILVFASLGSSAQNPYSINYDIKDGLPSSEVYDVEVDEKGIVWITTDRGVCTYDGYQFKTFTTQDGLADNTNFRIFKDSKNRLWFTGFSGKITIYEEGKFRPYIGNDSICSLLKGKWLGDILEGEDGIYYSSISLAPEMSLLKFKENSLPVKLDHDTLKTLDGYFKIGNDESFRIKDKAFVFYKSLRTKRNKTFNVITSVAFKNKNNWIHSHDSDFYLCDSTGQTITGKSTNVLIENTFIDDSKNIWLGTFKGLFCQKGGNMNQPLIHYFKKYNITGCVKDLEGGFWLSTLGKGVLFIPSFDVNTISAFEEDKKRLLCVETLNDHIFFGTSKSKIIAIDRDGESKEFSLKLSETKQVSELYIKGDSLLLPHYILYESEKKIVVRREKHNSNHYLFLSNGHKMYNSGGVTVRDKGGIISGVLEHKLDRYITSLLEDDSSVIWITTLMGIIKIKDYQYNNWEEVLVNGENPFGRVEKIAPDHLNNRWVATIGNGIFYHTEDDVFQIRKKDGLNSDMVNDVFILEDSILFVGTNKGLNVFNYQFDQDSLIISEVKSFTIEDGLNSDYINGIHYWNDLIWLATNDGICNFDTSFINKKNTPIPVFIEALIINDSIFTVSEDLVLDYNQNNFFINYNGISFKKEKEKNFYRYRLKTEVNEPNWFYTNEKSIRYTDLPPDVYNFEVAAQNKSGDWSKNPATFSFEIKPHFSDTLWFRILLILMILSLLIGFAYSRIRAVQVREIERGKLREAELAALRNQMNPHFIFNGFSAIQNFIFKKDTDKANHYLAKFSRLMRKSLQYSRLDYITLEEELDFIKNYVDLESMRFEDKFIFNLDVDETLDLDYLTIPSLLLQPVLENAIKHAFKDIEYKGILEVIVRGKDDDRLEIFIKDNGPGILNKTIKRKNKEPGHKSLGLEIIKNRINLLKETKSKIITSVNFRNRSEVNPEDTGLEVHFILPIKYKE